VLVIKWESSTDAHFTGWMMTLCFVIETRHLPFQHEQRARVHPRTITVLPKPLWGEGTPSVGWRMLLEEGRVFHSLPQAASSVALSRAGTESSACALRYPQLVRALLRQSARCSSWKKIHPSGALSGSSTETRRRDGVSLAVTKLYCRRMRGIWTPLRMMEVSKERLPIPSSGILIFWIRTIFQGEEKKLRLESCCFTSDPRHGFLSSCSD